MDVREYQCQHWVIGQRPLQRSSGKESGIFCICPENFNEAEFKGMNEHIWKIKCQHGQKLLM